MINRNINSMMDAFTMSILFNNQNNIINSLIIIIISNFISNIEHQSIIEYIEYILNKFLYKKKKHIIILEGKTISRSCEYESKVDNIFSKRFRAMWHYINSNNYKHDNNIYSIKEYPNSSDSNKSYRKNYNKNDDEYNFNINDLFIVNQKDNFIIDDDIFCTVKFNDSYDDNSNSSSRNDKKISFENITLEIFSYKHNITYLLNYVNYITNKYIATIENNRKSKLFIYTLKNNKINRHDDYYTPIDELWDECLFQSTRNFNNLFFDNKDQLIKKINFFKNNKNWYENNGHPYTLGIGLYGPPGTGKTSIIKSIANMLRRHLIVIPLNKITTQNEFSDYYFESKYNNDNSDNSINFDNKIIVLEDIDCMADIVKKRTMTSSSSSSSDNSNLSFDLLSDNNIDNDNIYNDNINDNDNDSDEIKKLNKINKFNKFKKLYVEEKNNDKITLSFILNIIDGIRETPGRILIITSNHYDQLDDALRRPGRIDIDLEMKNASINTINNIYHNYYNEYLDDDYIQKLIFNNADYKISPALITNIYINSNDKEHFKNLILNNIK